MKKINVPVVLYHSIGPIQKDWLFQQLTCPHHIFEQHLQWMKKKNFHTISLQQLYDHMNDTANLPPNPVVLTFDDGYLDNWVFAHPLLKKYGFNGTIYVNPEFVDPSEHVRKNLEDVWNNNANFDELETTGFLSWTEMKEMIRQGTMDIQSHAMTHTLYFKNNTLIDFRHPHDHYIWTTWNNHTEKKPYLQLDIDDLISYGEPIYEYNKAMITKRFFPDESLKDHLVSYVQDQGGYHFFNKDNWKEHLLRMYNEYKHNHHLEERTETEDEYKKRLLYELQESKEQIELALDKEIHFICWPVGGASKQTIETAQNLGYISSTVAKDQPLKNRKKMKNNPDCDPSRINRFGALLYWNEQIGTQCKTIYKNGFLFGLSLYSFQGRTIPRVLHMIITGFSNLVYKKTLPWG